jgi:hypothetical protein
MTIISRRNVMSIEVYVDINNLVWLAMYEGTKLRRLYKADSGEEAKEVSTYATLPREVREWLGLPVGQ